MWVSYSYIAWQSQAINLEFGTGEGRKKSMTSLNNNTQVDVVEEQHCMRFPAASSRGIWFGENPLDDTHTLMLAQIILVVVTYQLLYFLLRPLGQTKFVCNLLVLINSVCDIVINYSFLFG